MTQPLGPLTTYGVGGPAALFVEVEDDERPRRGAPRRLRRAATCRRCVLGRGSNLLVADAGFDGVVVQLGRGFAAVDLPDRGRRRRATAWCRAGGAVPPARCWPARRPTPGGRAWRGRSGCPGSVGGAVRMNAGGHGSDMAAVPASATRWVDLHSDAGGTDDVARLDYGYRSSSVRPGQRGARRPSWRSRPGSAEEEQAAVAAIVRWRRANQPGGSNAGSVFTNPAGDSAGRLIEAAGLKGFRLGHGPRVREARQLHPGRQGRPGRRRARA